MQLWDFVWFFSFFLNFCFGVFFVFLFWFFLVVVVPFGIFCQGFLSACGLFILGDFFGFLLGWAFYLVG